MPPARYQLDPLICWGTFQIVRCGCSRSALVLASSPSVAVRFVWVVLSWSWRIWLRPVRDSFWVVRERMAAWLVVSSEYSRPIPVAETSSVAARAIVHQRRSCDSMRLAQGERKGREAGGGE